MDNKKCIKIYFTDFLDDLKIESLHIYEILSWKYQIVFDKNNPDYLVFSCFGNNHLNYRDCVKIYWSGENYFPDFNQCDYAMGCAYLELGDRYFRFPEWVPYNRNWLYDKSSMLDEATLLNRKFCNFVYSNTYCADPFRVQFFKRLSKYKQVDSGGKEENNIGGCVSDKVYFIAGYKFTLAFENSSVDGYTTEKLIQPMYVNSLPIYWGNPLVHLDFNIDSMVYVKDYDDMEEAVAKIIALDNDDSAYLEKLQKPWFLNENYKNWREKLADFMYHIIEQDKEKSIRRAKYGRNFYTM